MSRTDAMWEYSEHFDQIIQRYSHIIVAQFFGHTHKDQWEIAYTNYSAPSAQSAVSITYIAPALTPTSGNPTFRVYSVDSDTYAVLDYTIYFANMTDGHFQTRPVWQEYYSAKEAYGPLLSPPQINPAVEMKPSWWHQVTEVFMNNDAVF